MVAIKIVTEGDTKNLIESKGQEAGVVKQDKQQAASTADESLLQSIRRTMLSCEFLIVWMLVILLWMAIFVLVRHQECKIAQLHDRITLEQMERMAIDADLMTEIAVQEEELYEILGAADEVGSPVDDPVGLIGGGGSDEGLAKALGDLVEQMEVA